MAKRLAFSLRVLLLIFLLLLSSPLLFAQGAETRPLLTLLRSREAVLHWNPRLESGLVRRGETSFRFLLGRDTVVVNGQDLETAGIQRAASGELIADAACVALVERLFPERDANKIRMKTIIIDPGHGGKDPGAIGRHRFDGEAFALKEKDLVLDVSRRLHSLLSEHYPDKEIILTRESDEYLSLEQRTEIANGVELEDDEAMVFISIHANASLNSRASGFEVWYLPPDYRRELIDPETIEPEIREVVPILNTMLEEEFTVESILLAGSVSEAMESAVGDLSENRGLKEESWFVVRNAKMPSVLVELGFVTNPREVKFLDDPDYLKKLTKGIYNGIVSFVDRFD